MSDLRVPELNRVVLAGRLTRDPELRCLPSGMAVCKLGLAADRRYRNKDGEAIEETVFINATCWGKTAEFVADNFHKGHPMIVEGSLKMDEWEDKSTGQTRRQIEITAMRVQCLEWHGNTRGKEKRSEEVQREEVQPDDDRSPF